MRETDKLESSLQTRQFLKFPYQLVNPFDPENFLTVTYKGETVNSVPQGMGVVKYVKSDEPLLDEIPSFKIYGRFANGQVSDQYVMFATCSSYVFKGADKETQRDYVRYYNKQGNLQYMGWANKYKNSDGRGTYINRQNGELYLGEWVDGLKKEGTITQADGSQMKVVYDTERDQREGIMFYE